MAYKLFSLGFLLIASAASGARTIALQAFQQKQFTVRATVHGHDRNFLFDTGEGLTMISPELAQAIGCTPRGNVAAFRMLGERLDLPQCDDVRFALSGTSYAAPTTIVYDLGKIAGADTRFDGAIGLDLFAGKVITLRFASNQVVIEDERSARRRRQSGIEVPIRLSRPSEGAALDVNIGVRTGRGMAWMELDSGNAGPTIFVSPAIAPEMGLKADTKEAQDVTATIAPGVVFHGKARVFPDMIMDGNIGLQFMRHWDLTLDLRAGRAWVREASAVR